MNEDNLPQSMEDSPKRKNFLRGNSWNIFSLAIGLIGILLAVYFGIASKKFKEPCYAIQYEQLIGDSSSEIKNLDIKVEGRKITNL